jgi:phospholipid/cholesterol/gamma-HCH transport system ATP-binding protein
VTIPVATAGETSRPTGRAPGIRIEGLNKAFDGQAVLRGIDLEVAPAELMVIIGRSGGGKSVLIRHLLGLVRPDSGRILVDGHDVATLRGRGLDRLRARFGVVFQGGALFDSLTAFENVLFPVREKTRLPADVLDARARAALEQVGLADMGHKYPAEISGGMKKRVAIARALVTEPEIVFLDEPTTGLDPVLVNSIHQLILDLHARFGFTAVMVSHEIPEIFRIADRVAVLHEGRIRQVGTAREIEGSLDPAVRRFIHGEVEAHAT